MTTKPNRKYREIVEFAESLGFSWDHTNSGHIRFLHPKVPKPVFTSSTPCDPRAHKNAKSELRRALRHAENLNAITDRRMNAAS